MHDTWEFIGISRTRARLLADVEYTSSHSDLTTTRLCSVSDKKLQKIDSEIAVGLRLLDMKAYLNILSTWICRICERLNFNNRFWDCLERSKIFV